MGLVGTQQETQGAELSLSEEGGGLCPSVGLVDSQGSSWEGAGA